MIQRMYNYLAELLGKPKLSRNEWVILLAAFVMFLGINLVIVAGLYFGVSLILESFFSSLLPDEAFRRFLIKAVIVFIPFTFLCFFLSDICDKKRNQEKEG